MKAVTEGHSSQPLHEQVYRRLSNELMQGGFEPGQRLTLRGLADDLGTSIAPVRQAVSRLATLKAVQVFPKRHIQVESMTAELYMEIVEIRRLLESHAAARASERMSDKEITNAEGINRVLLKHAGNGRVKRAMKENQRFHFAVYESAGSRVLLENIEQIWVRVGPSVNQLLAEEYARDESALQRGFVNHQRLVEALYARDANAAMNAISRDIGVSTGYLLDGLRRQSDRTDETLAMMGPG